MLSIVLLHEIASEAFMPLGYGGEITKLEHAKEIFRIGYEKIILNSLLYDNPDEVRKIVDLAGSQSVAASIDYKKDLLGHINVFTHAGADKFGCSMDETLKYVIELGVGEILLTSIDHEGKMRGYDIKTMHELVGRVNIPIIINGGAGQLSDIRDVLSAGADAVAASSFFIYYGKNQAILIHTPTEEDYS